jgi:hypothetical protein
MDGNPTVSEARLAWLLARMQECGGKGWISSGLIVHFPGASAAEQAPEDLDDLEAQILVLTNDPFLPSQPAELSALILVLEWLQPWISDHLRTSAAKAVSHWVAQWPLSAQVWEVMAASCPRDELALFSHLVLTADPLPGDAWPPAFLAAASLRMAETSPAGWGNLRVLADAAIRRLEDYAAWNPPAAAEPLEAWRAARIRALWMLGNRSAAIEACGMLRNGWPGNLYNTFRKIQKEASPEECAFFEAFGKMGLAGSHEAKPREAAQYVLKVEGDELWIDRFRGLIQEASRGLRPVGSMVGDFKSSVNRRWTLTWDTRTLGEGRVAPHVDEILDLAERATPGTLYGLGKYLARNPECLEARKRRMEALPHGHLSPGEGHLALEDTIRVLASPNALVSRGMKDAVQWRARAALAAVEDGLRRWPGQSGYWEAWLDWKQALGKPADPVGMAESLAWCPREKVGLDAGPVPFRVAEGVLNALKDRGRFREADHWASWIWNAGLARECAEISKEGWESPEARAFPGMGADRNQVLRRLSEEFLTPWAACQSAAGKPSRAMSGR